MKSITALLLLIIILPVSAGCTVTHKYGPYYGKVIDTETKEPIEGAVVLVVFHTEEWGPAGSITRFADALETVTDKNGEFKIPAHRVTTFRPLQGWDRYGYFTIFKPEYGCYPWSYPWNKDVKPMFVPGGTLPADQFVTIELPRLKAKEDRLRNQSCFPVSVPDEKMKKLIELNNIERVNLGLQPTHIKEEKQ